VSKQECGGYLNQPICNYDFTVRLLDHDHLIFSTRHLSGRGNWNRYVNENYFSLQVLDQDDYFRSSQGEEEVKKDVKQYGISHLAKSTSNMAFVEDHLLEDHNILGNSQK